MSNSQEALTAQPVDLREFTDYSREQVELIKNTVCRGASDDELRLFLMVCRRTQLDPFVRQIHAVFRNVKTREDGKEVWARVMSIQTGIDGYRLISERTGKYVGQDPPMWCGEDGVWKDVWLSKDFPRAAKAAVYKAGFEKPFVGIALWDEYVQVNWKDNKPLVNAMWSKMPAGQLQKCAEALAHRKAFPNETSHVYVKEELDQMDNDAPEDRKLIGSPTGDYVIQPKAEPAAELPAQSMTIPATATAMAPAAPATPAEDTPRKRGRPPKAAPAPEPPATPPPATEAAQPSVATEEPIPETTKVEYALYSEPILHGALIVVKTDPLYGHPDRAIERANKLASDTKITHVVMRIEKGNMRQHYRTDSQPKPQTADEPKPAETPKPKATTVTETTKRLNALAEFMEIPGETAMARFNSFFCGYFDIPLADMRKKAGTIPQDQRNEAMDALELTVMRDVELFNSGPLDQGRRTAVLVAAVKEYAGKQWRLQTAPDPKCQVLAWRTAILWGFSYNNFEKWVSNLQLDFMGPAEAEAFFRVCLRTPKNRAAATFIRLASDHRLSMDLMLKQMQEKLLKSPVEECTEAQVERAIEEVFKAVKDEASKPATPPPPATEPGPEDSGISGSLW